MLCFWPSEKNIEEFFSDAGLLKEKFRVFPKEAEPMTFWLLSSDALPLSYRRLVDKHPAYC